PAEATTQGMDLAPLEPAAPAPAAPAGSQVAPPAARPHAPAAGALGARPQPPQAGKPQPAGREAVAAGVPSVPSVFSPSKQFAIQVDEVAHDPELEEAAIRFANGDDDGAEAGLLEVLAPQGTRVNHDETWLTLFDLYRASGRQERFEQAAIDFANRFG